MTTKELPARAYASADQLAALAERVTQLGQRAAADVPARSGAIDSPTYPEPEAATWLKSAQRRILELSGWRVPSTAAERDIVAVLTRENITWPRARNGWNYQAVIDAARNAIDKHTKQ